MLRRSFLLVFALLVWSLVIGTDVFAKPRARDLGIPFEGEPGPFNAITDVAGVEVGHVTLIEGDGEWKIGKGRCVPALRRSSPR